MTSLALPFRTAARRTAARRTAGPLPLLAVAWLTGTPALAAWWVAAQGEPARQPQAAWLLLAVAAAGFGLPFVATLVALDRGATRAGLAWFVVAVLAVGPALTLACHAAGALRGLGIAATAPQVSGGTAAGSPGPLPRSAAR